jgi:hypothetical protein
MMKRQRVDEDVLFEDVKELENALHIRVSNLKLLCGAALKLTDQYQKKICNLNDAMHLEIVDLHKLCTEMKQSLP